VLASFLVLALLVIAVRAAGQKAGWGIQFGNPQFLVILTVLVTLVALNLFGLFEVTLGGQAMTAAGSLAARHGATGAFFNGVLATALATPCTAPFLSIALGFAFTQQNSFSTVLVFLTIGLGLAFPYVLLSWNPVWLKFVPKPGAWMEHFKVAMGFPMLATALWLFSLIPIHYGDRSWWLGIFLVFVAVAAWVYGQFVQRGRSRRGLAAGIALAILLSGYFWSAETQLDWRSPGAAESASALVQHSSSGVQWEPWSREAVTAGQAAGRPVLVDFTAKWCLTCNTVVKPALESKAVSAKLRELNAVALVGDYTKFPPAITDELNRYRRAGVPLVLVYPPDPGKDALVLPEALTPGMVVDALERAVQHADGNYTKVTGG
jgi:thiol:disulfide interchange protein DsbD